MNAACLALVDASLAMRCLFAAVTVAAGADGSIVIDPSKKEARKLAVTITFVFESTKKDIVTTKMDGKCSEKSFQKCLGAARDASEAVFEFYRDTLKRKFSKELELSQK